MKHNLIHSAKFAISLYLFSILLVAFIFFQARCREVAKPLVEPKNIFLPTEAQIAQVLQSKEDYKMLDDHAKSKAERNAKEYHAKLAIDISDEELQPYYNKYKPAGMENLGVEAISRERKKILDRLVWYKIVQEVNLKVEMKELEFKKVDWKKIAFDEEIHEDAFQAHISANCVLEVQPEKYWSHFKTLFDNYKSLQKENLISFIQDNGINEEKWKACMKDPELQKQIIAEIQEDLKEGKKMGIKGTPTFIINGKLIVGARGFDFFDSIIEKELKAVK